MNKVNYEALSLLIKEITPIGSRKTSDEEIIELLFLWKNQGKTDFTINEMSKKLKIKHNKAFYFVGKYKNKLVKKEGMKYVIL